MTIYPPKYDVVILRARRLLTQAVMSASNPDAAELGAEITTILVRAALFGQLVDAGSDLSVLEGLSGDLDSWSPEILVKVGQCVRTDLDGPVAGRLRC